MRKFILVILAVMLVFPAYRIAAFDSDGIFIPHTFNVFEEPSFSSPLAGTFAPSVVFVLEEGEGDWARIGSGWINLRYSPAVDVLDGFFSPLGNNVAVFYKNLDTGFTYVHNPDRVFFAASLSKSNHALYAYQLAERGQLDMAQIHTLTGEDAWGGTGVIRFMPWGREFTTRELLGYSIRESDNMAYRFLVRLLLNANPTYHQFVTEIGADMRMVQNVISQNTHARDAGLFMYEIFRYIEGDGRYAHYFKYDLMNTSLTSHPYFTRWEGSMGYGGEINVEMLVSDYPIARKYGWARNAFHDAGIVYAPSPYILVVLTNMERGAHDLIAEISWFMQDFNHAHFVSPVPLNAPNQGPQAIFDPAADTVHVFLPINGEVQNRPQTAAYGSTKAEVFADIPSKVFRK